MDSEYTKFIEQIDRQDVDNVTLRLLVRGYLDSHEIKDGRWQVNSYKHIVSDVIVLQQLNQMVNDVKKMDERQYLIHVSVGVVSITGSFSIIRTCFVLFRVEASLL